MLKIENWQKKINPCPEGAYNAGRVEGSKRHKQARTWWCGAEPRHSPQPEERTGSFLKGARHLTEPQRTGNSYGACTESVHWLRSSRYDPVPNHPWNAQWVWEPHTWMNFQQTSSFWTYLLEIICKAYLSRTNSKGQGAKQGSSCNDV